MNDDKTVTQTGFNPSGKEVVDEIKARTESLIEYVNANVPDNRQRQRAIDHLEDASMLAVKANFM